MSALITRSEFAKISLTAVATGIGLAAGSLVFDWIKQRLATDGPKFDPPPGASISAAGRHRGIEIYLEEGTGWWWAFFGGQAVAREDKDQLIARIDATKEAKRIAQK